jgi:hypothetical protein
MNEQIMTALIMAGVGIIGAVGTLAVAAIDRLRATIAVDSCKRTAGDFVDSAISTATEDHPVDEGSAIQIAENYLRDHVGQSIKKLGGNPATMAAGIALGAIARAGRQ